MSKKRVNTVALPLSSPPSQRFFLPRWTSRAGDGGPWPPGHPACRGAGSRLCVFSLCHSSHHQCLQQAVSGHRSPPPHQAGHSLPYLEFGWGRIRAHGQLLLNPVPFGFSWMFFSPLSLQTESTAVAGPFLSHRTPPGPGKSQSYSVHIWTCWSNVCFSLHLPLVSPLCLGLWEQWIPIRFGSPGGFEDHNSVLPPFSEV